MTNRGISAIIPNYNGIELLPEILPSLFNELKKTKLPFEVIISDDCSKDDSLNFIKIHYPEIILLESEANEGFSKTINKGIFKAKYDFLFLMNSDLKLCDDYFLNQLRYFEREDTFGVMGRIMGWDDGKVQDGGKLPSFHLFKIKTSLNYLPTHVSNNEWLPSVYLSGANALVSRAKILEIKGFNEIYSPFYVEDFDLCIRAWRMGWKCYYEHNSVCNHKTSITIKSNHRKNYIKSIYYRNKMYLHAFHLTGFNYSAWFLQNIFEVFFQTLLGKKYFLHSFIMFLKGKSKLIELKKDFNKNAVYKKNSFKQIANYIFSELSTKEIIKF